MMEFSQDVRDALVLDRQRITEASLPDIADRIAAYGGSIDDINDWYFSHDPVVEEQEGEQLRLMAMAGSKMDEAYFEDSEAKTKSATTYEAAAFTLLVSIAEPELMQTDPEHWSVQYREKYLKNKPFAGPEQLLGHVLPKLPTELTDEQAGRLYMAIDCMHLSSSLYTNQASKLSQIMRSGNTTESLAILQRQCQDKADVYFPASLALILGMQERTKNSTDPEVKKMVFKAGMFAFAAFNERRAAWNKFSPDEQSKTALTETMQTSVQNFAKLIEGYFLDGLAPNTPVIKGSPKGDLHEALYLLDLTFLLTTNQDKYPNWHAKPVFPRMDSPKIGYPTLNRGVDVTLNDCSRNIMVQLKAGNGIPGKEKDYHPRILFLREENFQDANVRRLRSKLRAYTEWANGGFSDAGAERVQRYVLPTATATLAEIDRTAKLRQSDFLMQSMVTGGLTRAERRRIARRLGEFNARKTNRR
ncbi:hypothetical protein BH09PAT3_BH09PAT3_6260 [soil metagenome]